MLKRRTLANLEDCIAPETVEQGTTYSKITDESLDLLTEAYVEATEPH